MLLLRAVVRFAVDRFAVVRFAVDFLAVERFAGARFAVVRLAVVLRPVLDRDEERVRAGTVRGACSCCSVSPNPSGPPVDHSVGESDTSDSLAPVPLQSSWVIYDLLGLSCVARFPTTVSL